jgi:hypothetical protein
MSFGSLYSLSSTLKCFSGDMGLLLHRKNFTLCFKLLEVCQINIFLSDLVYVCVAKPNSDIHICIFLIPVSDVIFG